MNAQEVAKAFATEIPLWNLLGLTQGMVS